MIVQPDFLDDWRMGVLTDLLGGDPLTPIYVIRLWSHCQMKRAWSFPDIPPAGLKSVCRAAAHHNPETFYDSMLNAGIVANEGAGFSVPSFEAHNAQLLAAWTNGSKGGRRPTEKNPTKTGRLTDKRRGEKKTPPAAPVGADAPPSPPAPKPAPPAPPAPAPEPPKPPPAPAPSPAPAPRPTAAPGPAPGPSAPGLDLFGEAATGKGKRTTLASPEAVPRPDWIPADTWGQFLAYRLEMARKSKAAPFTASAIKGSIRYFEQCRSAGEAPEDAFLRMSAHGWRVPYPDRAQVGANVFRAAPATAPTAAQRSRSAGAGFRDLGETNEDRASDAIDVAWRDVTDGAE